MKQEYDPIIKTTIKWLETVVIGLNFCPFALKPFKSEAIKFLNEKSDDDEELLLSFCLELDFLNKNPNTSTTLIVYPNQFPNFEGYLNWASICEKAIEMNNYEGVFQVATFHPDYCFEGVDQNDAANYTNRSPFPMLHIIREDEIEMAREKHPNVESIPETNIRNARQLGIDKMRALFKACFM